MSWLEKEIETACCGDSVLHENHMIRHYAYGLRANLIVCRDGVVRLFSELEESENAGC